MMDHKYNMEQVIRILKDQVFTDKVDIAMNPENPYTVVAGLGDSTLKVFGDGRIMARLSGLSPDSSAMVLGMLILMTQPDGRRLAGDALMKFIMGAGLAKILQDTAPCENDSLLGKQPPKAGQVPNIIQGFTLKEGFKFEDTMFDKLPDMPGLKIIIDDHAVPAKPAARKSGGKKKRRS